MSKQRNREEKIPVVPLYSGPVKVLAIPPFGASSNNGLWRAKDKPPVELVVANLDFYYTSLDVSFRKWTCRVQCPSVAILEKEFG